MKPKMNPQRVLLSSTIGMIVLATPASIFLWDRPIIEYLNTRQSAAVTAVASLIGGLANPVPYLLSSTAVFVIAKYQSQIRLTANRALFMLLAVAIAGIGADILQVFFGRARPYLYLQQHVDVFHPFKNDPSFTSFPSEHAAVAAAVAAALSILIPDLRPTFALLALMIAASRVSIGLHYPSDVLAGLLLGLAIVAVLTGVFEHLKLGLHKATWDSGRTPT